MNTAMEEAKKALSEEEVPIGCSVMHKGECIKKSHNLTNTLNDPLAHAEMLAIKEIPLSILHEVELFVTCEPCIMCMSMLVKMNIKKITYGCSNTRFGGISVLPILKILPNKEISVIQDPSHKEEALSLLKTFYSTENTRAPPEKRKHKSNPRKIF